MSADRDGQTRLTGRVVREALPQIDPAKAAAIAETGATIAEFEEAVAWAAGESDVLGPMGRALNGPAATIYEILTADMDDGASDEDR